MQRIRLILPFIAVLLLAAGCLWLVLRTGSVPEPPPLTRAETAAPTLPAASAEPDWGDWTPAAATPAPASAQDSPVPTAEPEGHAVVGRVFDERGAPIAGAELYINRQQLETGEAADAITGADGRFLLQDPPPQGFRLSAYHEAHPPGYEVVPSNFPPSQELRIVLPDGGAVAGRVTVGGSPLGDAHVTLGPVGGQYRKVGTDGQGRYRIGGIAPGRYDIMARYTSGGTNVLERHSSRQVEISIGRTTTQDFNLYGGAAILRGRIRVGDGPAERSRINGVVTVPDGEREIFNLEVVGGDYALNELPPGRLSFNVHVLEYAGQHQNGLSPYAGNTDNLRRSESFEIQSGQVYERDFEFFPAVGIRGTVQGIRADERASVLVLEGYREINSWTMDTFLTLAAQKIRSQRVGSGTFIVNDLPPSDYTVLAYIEPRDVTMDPEAVLASLRVDMLYIALGPGEMQELALDLR